jgi:superfamily II DNA or RNA helicase
MQQTEDGFSRTLVVRETSFVYPPDGDSPIQEIFRGLVHDVARNDLIEKDVCQALDRGRRCLILSQWKEHCEALADSLVRKGRSPFVLSGTVGKKKRSAILNSIQETGPDKELLIIATGQYLGEGFDCPQVDTLFLAFPISFKGKLVQYVGRALRSHEGKKSVIVHDYADNEVPILRKMHARRLRTYKLLRFVSENGAASSALKTVNRSDAPLNQTLLVAEGHQK